MKRNMTFYASCVQWPQEDVNAPGGLCDMCDEAEPITRNTFIRRVDRADREDLERCLGYALNGQKAGLKMKQDRHVGYYCSTLHGDRVYFFTHSAIEYVFTRQVAA